MRTPCRDHASCLQRGLGLPCPSVDIFNAFNTIDRSKFLKRQNKHPSPANGSLGPNVTGPTNPPPLCEQHNPKRAGRATGKAPRPILFAMGIQQAIEKVSVGLSMEHQAGPAGGTHRCIGTVGTSTAALLWAPSPRSTRPLPFSNPHWLQ